MSYTRPKEAALKLLISTANNLGCPPNKAIDEAKKACDSIISIHHESGKSIPGFVKYQTNYWTKVKQWLDKPDLIAF